MLSTILAIKGLPMTSPAYKTVTVSFQLRVPDTHKASRELVHEFVSMAIKSEPGKYMPDNVKHEFRLYKDRVEVFMP